MDALILRNKAPKIQIKKLNKKKNKINEETSATIK